VRDRDLADTCLERLREEQDKLRSQRDKLLAACEMALPFVSPPFAWHLAQHLESSACDEHEECSTLSDSDIQSTRRAVMDAIEKARKP
jgi:hypothetical protein